jgi:hypothetical protein
MSILERVTVTGADDGTDPEDLFRLSVKYPFVEWGILLSKSQEGNSRFPSLRWIEHLKWLIDGKPHWFETEGKKTKPALSGHLCGSWVRELCAGRLTFLADRPTICAMFERVQLNFHANTHSVHKDEFTRALKSWKTVNQYIFQFDNTNNWILATANAENINVAPLFDTSGGAGIYPGSWPLGFGASCGYAGGLHPDKITEQLPRIRAAAEHCKIWIDIETHVRSNDDKLFDLDKVEKFLAAVAPEVGKWL